MKKRVFLWAWFAGVLFLWVTFAQAAEQRLVIKGKVIDGNSMTPVPGAFVEIENASGGSGYSRDHTDQNGEFTFKNLPTGVSFNTYAEKEGYTSYRRLYWGVDRNKEMESVVVKLAKEAVLQCRITTSDKVTPITRARVTMKPMGWRRDRNAVYEFERESGDNGQVKIDKIPSGAYELIIEKSGYIRERLTNIKFLTGKMKEMDVALYRPASISGRLKPANTFFKLLSASVILALTNTESPSLASTILLWVITGAEPTTTPLVTVTQ